VVASFLIAAGGQVVLDGLVDSRRSVVLTDVRQQQRHRHDRSGRIGDALSEIRMDNR
jgi:hypothetical protein